jgi:hypothetical protein
LPVGAWPGDVPEQRVHPIRFEQGFEAETHGDSGWGACVQNALH